MNTIRIGNDVSLVWTILRDGEPENLADKKLGLYLQYESGARRKMEFTIDGNRIFTKFAGRDQKAIGLYYLTLIENDGEDGMATIDSVDAFRLVSRSSEARVYCTESIETEVISLSSSLSPGAVVALRKELQKEVIGKLDSNGEITEQPQAYVKAKDGSQQMTDISDSPSPSTLMYRNAAGQTSVEAPTAATHATNKQYVDAGLDTLKNGRAPYKVSLDYTIQSLLSGKSHAMDVENGIIEAMAAAWDEGRKVFFADAAGYEVELKYLYKATDEATGKARYCGGLAEMSGVSLSANMSPKDENKTRYVLNIGGHPMAWKQDLTAKVVTLGADLSTVTAEQAVTTDAVPAVISKAFNEKGIVLFVDSQSRRLLVTASPADKHYICMGPDGKPFEVWYTGLTTAAMIKPVNTPADQAVARMAKDIEENSGKADAAVSYAESNHQESLDSRDLPSLPLLCGQPMILFGNGTPSEATVPDNWRGILDGGYAWTGSPSAIGQQYINTSAATGGRYIAVRDSYNDLKWLNS